MDDTRPTSSEVYQFKHSTQRERGLITCVVVLAHGNGQCSFAMWFVNSPLTSVHWAICHDIFPLSMSEPVLPVSSVATLVFKHTRPVTMVLCGRNHNTMIIAGILRGYKILRFSLIISRKLINHKLNYTQSLGSTSSATNVLVRWAKSRDTWRPCCTPSALPPGSDHSRTGRHRNAHRRMLASLWCDAVRECVCGRVLVLKLDNPTSSYGLSKISTMK